MKSHSYLILSTSLVMSIAAIPAYSAEEEEQGLSGKGELGFIKKTGNTETETLTGKLTLDYIVNQWEHYGKVEAYNDSTDDVTTAERYTGEYKLSYLMSKIDYLFGNVRFVTDRFEDIDQSWAYTGGWGHRFYNEKKLKLKTELGAGYKSYDYIDAEDREEAIVRGYLDFLYGLTDTAKFTQTALVEYGEDNTFVETESGLAVAINSSLALKASYTWRHNTDPVAGKEKSDTITALSLTYDF
jgi:putative salt-induced outer membrane protein